MNTQLESARKASGRRMSVVEGFVQTIGINMGGIYVPNFILTAFLLNVMHASNVLIGFATATQFFVGLLQPLANLLVPKLRHRRVMVALTGTLSRLLFVGALFLGMVWSGPGAESTFMVVMFLGALTMAFSASGWSTWMADIVPENSRGNYFALRNSICAVAGILAVLGGGWILRILPGTEGYAVIYGICAVTAIVGGVFLLFQYEPEQAPPSGQSQFASYKAIFRDRNFMAYVRTVILFNLALVIAGPFFTVHFLQELKVPLDIMAILTAGAAVMGILGNVFFGKLSDILGNRFIIRLTIFATIIPTLGMLFIPAQDNLIFVAGIMLLLAFLMSGWNLAAFNTSLGISPRSERALYIGVYNSLISVSAIVAPLIGGWLIDFYKANPFPVLGMVFASTIPVFVVSAVLLLVGLLTFPMYQEGSRTEDYSLRDVVLRLDFPEIIYKLFLSTFIPRISKRHKLVDEIGDLRSPAAVVPLERLLRDMDPSIRLSALEGLGKIGAAEARDVLLDFFPEAGVLERIEVMKSFGAFATDPKIRDILLSETTSPWSTLRIQALFSLGAAARDPLVADAVAKRLEACASAMNPASDPGAPLVPTVPPMSDEEYLAYLDLACRNQDARALLWSLPRYAALSGPQWKDRFLYSWSLVIRSQESFYRFLSADAQDGRPALLEEELAAVMDLMLRDPALKEIRPFLRDEAKEHRHDLPGWIRTIRKALNLVLKDADPALRDTLLRLADRPDRSMSEDVFLLLGIRSVLDDRT